MISIKEILHRIFCESTNKNIKYNALLFFNMFSHAIVREPSKSIVNGITNANLGIPDYHQALKQHQRYCKALKACGLTINKLPPEEKFPDSCFIEDTAIINEKGAIITRPGAISRREEIHSVAPVLEAIYQNIASIEPPGTVDGGDILRIKKNYYIGLSKRTNKQGAEQLSVILSKLGFKTTFVKVSKYLHLKTGINHLADGIIIVTEEFVNHPAFKDYKQIVVPIEEEYAANSIHINGYILTPKGYPKTIKQLLEMNKSIKEIPLTEFQKLDGGVSCLSLRY